MSSFTATHRTHFDVVLPQRRSPKAASDVSVVVCQVTVWVIRQISVASALASTEKIQVLPRRRTPSPAYVPGLKISGRSVLADAGRPFMVKGLKRHCLTASIAVRANAREPWRN